MNFINLILSMFSGSKVSQKANLEPKRKTMPASEAKALFELKTGGSTEKGSEPWEKIDWDNKNARISKYFTVGEATYLPSWDVFHNPTDDEKYNIWEFAKQMDSVREIIKHPINVHVWIRPILIAPGHPRDGQDYNRFIGGAQKSAHRVGRAVDWSSSKRAGTCDELRAKLVNKLEELNLRMEDLPGSNWIHNDNYPVGNKRFFKP